MNRNRGRFALFAVLALILYFFENNTGSRIVLAGTIALPLFSVCLAGLAQSKVRIQMQLPERIVTPQILKGQLLLEAPGRPFGYFVHVVITGTHSLLNRQKQWDAVIPAASQTSVCLETFACGAMEFSLERAEVQDLFGLWSFPLEIRESAVCLIEPDTYPVWIGQESAAVQMDDVEPSGNLKSQNPFEVSGFRNYIPGDRVRDIHWKLSAKAEQLLVREGEQTSESCTLLCLDRLDDVSGDGAVLDECITALASVSMELSRAGVFFGIGLRGRFEGPVLSETERRVALARLLMGDLLTDDPEMPLVSNVPEQYTRVFLFTDHPGDPPDPDWAEIPCLRICPREEDLNGDAVLLCRTHPYILSDQEGLAL